MVRNIAWEAPPDPASERRGAVASIACIVFVAAMGAAFWVGAVWASHAWFGVQALR